MFSRSQLIKKYKTATATNRRDGKVCGAVMVMEVGGSVSIWTYAPESLGSPVRQEEFESLVLKAMTKLGWSRDRRCNGGFRKNG